MNFSICRSRCNSSQSHATINTSKCVKNVFQFISIDIQQFDVSVVFFVSVSAVVASMRASLGMGEIVNYLD